MRTTICWELRRSFDLKKLAVYKQFVCEYELERNDIDPDCLEFPSVMTKKEAAEVAT